MWQPQQRVDVALLVSSAAVIGCVVLALVPRRRRRRRGRIRDDESADVDGPQRPTLVVPFRADGPPVRPLVALSAAVVTGAVAGAISSGVAGLAVGVATVVVLLVPRLRVVLGILAIGGILAAAVTVVATQLVDHVPAGGDWTLSFGAAGRLAWAGVVFLGADAVVEVIVGKTGQPGRPILVPRGRADDGTDA